MKKTYTLLFGGILLFSLAANAQLPDYKTRIRYLYDGINSKLKDQKAGLYYETTDSIQKENPHSWLWPLCALIQATNEMEVLEPKKGYMLPAEHAIDQYYSDAAPAAAYQDYVLKERKSSKFYDDNEWIAIAYLDAYKRNKKSKYLLESEKIYRFLMTGIDNAGGGGMYWKEGDMDTKNTCSNGPGVLVALELYNITKKQEYLKKAIELYDWTNKNLQRPDGVFWDNINVKTKKIDKATYTYNTGTMLQSSALLYKITKDKKYLIEAQRVAQAGKAHFFKNNRLPGNYWFNAVMLRGYIELYKIDKNREWIDFYKTDADEIWLHERDSNNMVGKKKSKSLIDQSAMIEIYARLQQLR